MMIPARCLLGIFFLSHPSLAGDDVPVEWKLIQKAVEHQGVQGPFEQVLEHMRGIDIRRATVANRLDCVMRGLAEPWTVPAISADLLAMLAEPIESNRGPEFRGLGAGLARWLDLADFEESSPAANHPGLQELDSLLREIQQPELKGLALLEALSGYMGLCHVLLGEALRGYEPEELESLFGGVLGFYEAYYRQHFPKAPLSPEAKEKLKTFESLLRQSKGDRELLLAVANSLLQLSDGKFMGSLPRRLGKLKGKGLGRDILAIVGDSPENRVVLAGRKSSVHTERAALIIDLGGADKYSHAAVVDSEDQLASVVLDLGGADTYTSSGPGPAFSVGGVALLIDRKGKDTYRSKRLGQAATTLGFAALIDMDGDDRYEAEDFAQGHASGGIALLYDVQGNDHYNAWAFSQGGGIGNGLCALVDGEGDDRYLADLAWPDVYGNSGPNVHHGASQGYSTGIRPSVAGGIGVLLDLGLGRDRYQSGSFAQGGGYYFSLGLMYDGGGDDENFGSRYSQGFGVHQAIGVRWDAGGNDQYTCRSVAHTGMAWDEGVGYLIEDGGDDVYRTGDLSCGGAAQTGIAIHLDRGGSDIYRTGKESQGGTGSSDYHNKPSIGVLIDLGGDPDTYSSPGRGDQSVRGSPGVELFIDAKAKSMKKALKSKLLR